MFLTWVPNHSLCARQHYELFNMTKDPHQLENLYYHADPALTSELQTLLLQHWNCSGASCP